MIPFRKRMRQSIGLAYLYKDSINRVNQSKLSRKTVLNRVKNRVKK
jgi:hypothetical protein